MAAAEPQSEPTLAPAPIQGETEALIVEEMAPLREALAPLIRAAQSDYQIPGLSLALVRHDRILWLEGFGLADDPEQQRPAQAQTRYRAGSLAKPITALLVLAQQAQGTIDIDQPVGSALPGFRLKARFDQTAQPITYSNLGYSLLGHLLQVVTQTPFAAHAQQALFEPLGLSHSRFAAQPTFDDSLAIGHRNGQRFAPLPLRDLPAQGLETSAADMARLSIALLCTTEPTETLPAEGHFATDLGLIAIQPQQDSLCACMTGEQLDLMAYPQGWIGAAPSTSDQRGD
ncbi:serine hydrolase domain-containing protein [Halochromatium salexigens]|nr:serine hydrolase domain-containing protein [Halochromatium salexigens]